MVTIDSNSPSEAALPAIRHAVEDSTISQKYNETGDNQGEDESLQREVWPTGGTASDPEVEGGRERSIPTRKKTVRWKMDTEGMDDQSPLLPIGAPSRPPRRRTRSLSGDELFNYRLPSNWTEMTQPAVTRAVAPISQPAPVVILDLPAVEGGWQTKPFSPSSGIPTIIKRPTIDELAPEPLSSRGLTSENLLDNHLTASPVTFPALSVTETDDSLPSKSTAPSSENHSTEGSALLAPMAEDAPADAPTAPSSPLFPPLPTHAPSFITIIPKFTPPNFVQSPKAPMSRPLSKDRSASEITTSPRLTSSTEPYKHDSISRPQPSSSRFSRQSSISHISQQTRSNQRRQLHPTSSATSSPLVTIQPTQPSPPNPISLTTSPRSPAGHSLSPHTPQSTVLSPAPLPSISIVEENDFTTPVRSESPPWQMVGSSVGVTSPRMKTPSWRSEVINNSPANLLRSPPVTPFTSIHLQIDELPNEDDSDHESLRPPDPIPASSILSPLTPISAATEPLPSPRPEILSPSPPKSLILEPSTPPFRPDDVPLDEDEIHEILQGAYMPWPIRTKEANGILPVRKVVKRTERGEWNGSIHVNDVPRESAHWRLVRAQRLWLEGNKEFFKLKHPSGLPQDHKLPKIQYVDGGEPLKAVETLVQSILLDPRVVSWKSLEARRDFMEQLAWQFYADARHTGWLELVNIDHDLDEMFAKAQFGSKVKGHFINPGVISTRRAFASFIRNHVILATTEEADGFTQAAIQRYGRALDMIDWVKANLGPSPDRMLYGRGDAKERIEVVYDGVFGRGVQIRHGLTLIAQYKHVKKDPRCSHLRTQVLEELLDAARNLFASFEEKPMSPYVKKDLTLDVYVSDYVYHLAYAFLFRGFYGRENAKIILDMGQPSPMGGTSAADIARSRSKSSAQALAQAALLFPDDEEERVECLEMALEEILKVGGLRVGEARAMYRSLKDVIEITDKLWNCPAEEVDDDGDDDKLAFFDDPTSTKKKKKKSKKKVKKEGEGTDSPVVTTSTIPKDPITPKLASPSTLPSPPPATTPRTQPTPRTRHILLAFLDSWFGSLQRNLDEKRIMNGDILHSARDLRGKPEVVWEEMAESSGNLEDDDLGESLPWASWGMKSVKAMKWEDLVKEEGGSKSESKSAGKGKQPTAKSTTTLSPTKALKPASSDSSPTKSKGARTSFDVDSEPRRSTDVWSISSGGGQADPTISPKSTSSGNREPKPAAQDLDRPTPWAVIARISKEKFFSINLDVFEGNEVKK